MPGVREGVACVIVVDTPTEPWLDQFMETTTDTTEFATTITTEGYGLTVVVLFGKVLPVADGPWGTIANGANGGTYGTTAPESAWIQGF